MKFIHPWNKLPGVSKRFAKRIAPIYPLLEIKWKTGGRYFIPTEQDIYSQLLDLIKDIGKEGHPSRCISRYELSIRVVNGNSFYLYFRIANPVY